jgi:hypothetical protein
MYRVLIAGWGLTALRRRVPCVEQAVVRSVAYRGQHCSVQVDASKIKHFYRRTMGTMDAHG